ncbi:MAG: BrnT family toxin [archaeon]|nr:BrnT family toxin [archaeon]
MRIKRLKWDECNIIHTARHGITVKDVEDACSGRHIARKVKDRYLIYGETEAGRHILVLLEKTGDNFRPITARDMSGNEKKIYKKKVK